MLKFWTMLISHLDAPRCHNVGHVMTDCESNFMNKYMGKGVEVPGIRVTTLIDPQLMKASLTTPTFRRDKTIEYL
jgi:hypothetical protein